MTEPRRTSSASQRLGLATCPECNGMGEVPLGVVANVVPCPECHGAKKVTLARHHELVGLKALHHDTEPPDTWPDPRREE